MQDEISGETKKADGSDHWSTIYTELAKSPGNLLLRICGSYLVAHGLRNNFEACSDVDARGRYRHTGRHLDAQVIGAQDGDLIHHHIAGAESD